MSRLLAVLAAALTTALTACGEGAPDQGTASPMPASSSPAMTAEPPPGGAEAAWYDDYELSLARQGADTGTVWLAGWFMPEALDSPQAADMEVRWREAPGLSRDAPHSELVRAAFAALRGEGPVDLLNPLEGVPLELRASSVEQRDGRATAVLDFGAGIEAANQRGSMGRGAASAQFLAMVAHYFPEAEQVVVTVEGRGAPTLFDEEGWDAPVPLEPVRGPGEGGA